MEASMTRAKDPDERHYHQLPKDHLADVFGDDVLVGLEASEPSQEPSQAIQTMMSNAAKAQREAHRARLDASLDQARAVERDRAAYEKIVIRGEPGKLAEKIAAERYAKATGVIKAKPSSEIMAEEYHGGDAA
jgi:hypothetical protein